MTDVAEQQNLNGWVESVNKQLERLTTSVDEMRVVLTEQKVTLDNMSRAQARFLTLESPEHQNVLETVRQCRQRVTDLERVSGERQHVVDKAGVYMGTVDKIERELASVRNTMRWVLVAVGTIAVSLAGKWLEAVLLKPIGG